MRFFTCFHAELRGNPSCSRPAETQVIILEEVTPFYVILELFALPIGGNYISDHNEPYEECVGCDTYADILGGHFPLPAGKKRKGERRDSNPRPPEPQSGALTN